MKDKQISEHVNQLILSYKAAPINFAEGEEGEYFYLEGHKHTFVQTVEDVVNKFKGADPGKVKILEIGAFLGIASITLADLGFDVTATDIEEFLSNQRIQERFNRHGVKFKACDLRSYQLPFEDEQFDAVIMCESLEHLNFNPLPVIKEINRVLKTNGIFYVTVPNQATLSHRLLLLEGNSIHNPISDFFLQLQPNTTMIVGLHWREYTAVEIKQMLEGLNLKVTEQRYDVAYEWTEPPVGLKRRVKKLLWRFFNAPVVKKFIFKFMFDSGFDESLRDTQVTLAVKEKPADIQFHFTSHTRPGST